MDKKCRTMFSYALVLSFLCLTNPVSAYDSGVTVKTLLKSTTAANGQHHEYLKTDRPEVTACIVEIAPGAQTGWHSHSVPVYAYVMEGTLMVTLEDGKVFSFEKGQALIEVMNIAHNGKSVGKEKVRLLVFYTGEEGKPMSVKVSP
ncbi:MAG: hypothetical protein CSYNP_00867 [Syntrophus sp. SKADARSKE-3]|nr:hypothetical protein [Syntrophus sp. SKADARSKE-3]